MDRRKIIKNKKGFTLIEVLATVVILGILMTIGIVSVTKVIKSSHEKFDKTQYETFVETAQTYFTDNKSRLPITPMETKEVTLQELIDLKYIDKILDSNKNEFDYSESKVVVTRLETGKYKYDGILVRKKGDPIGSIPTTVNNANSQILFELKNKDQYYKEDNIYYTNKQPQISITMSDSEGLAGYRYIVYKNGKQFKSSENIKIDGNTTFTDTITLGKEYSYGKYSLKVTVYDQKGNKTTKTSANDFIVYIDRIKPTCSISINGKSGDNSWYKERNITLTLKEVDKESGILKHGLSTSNSFSSLSNLKTVTQISKTQSDTAGITWYAYVQDKAGNVCNPNISVKVDTQKPTCDIKGASTEEDTAAATNLKTVKTNTWYNIETSPDINFLRLVHSDLGPSGVSKYIIAKNDATLAVNYRSHSNLHEIKTTDGQDTYYGYVRDKAGNEKECSVSIKKDTVAPTCDIKGSTSKTGGSLVTVNTKDWYNIETSPAIKFLRLVYSDPGDIPSGISGVSNYIIARRNSSLESNYASLSNLDYIETIDGQDRYYGYVRDVAGNGTSCQKDIKKDTIAPTCSIVSGTTYNSLSEYIWYNKYTASEISSIRLLPVDSGTRASGINRKILKWEYSNLVNDYKYFADNTLIGTVEGKYTYYGYVNDNAGNYGTCSQYLKKDTISPNCPSKEVISTSNPPNEYEVPYDCWKSYSYSCDKTCTDEEGKEYTCPGTCWSDYLTTCYKTITKYVSDTLTFRWYNFASDITKGHMYAKENSSSSWYYQGTYYPPSSSSSFTILGQEEFYGGYSSKIEVFDEAANDSICTGGSTSNSSGPDGSDDSTSETTPTNPPACPTIFSQTADPNTWVNRDVTLTITDFASDATTFDWYTDYGDGNWKLASTGNSATDTIKTLESEGTRRGKLVVYNKEGQSSECISPTYYIDKTAPTDLVVNMYKETEKTGTSTASPYTSGWYKYFVYTTANATDAASGIDKYYYTTTGATTNATDAEGSTRYILAGGTSTIKYKACDKAGNCTDYTSAKTVKLDHAGPECKISVTNDPAKKNGWYTENVKLKVTCSDEDSGCTDDSKSITKTISKDTIEDIEFEVEDNVGRKGTCVKEVALDKTPPDVSWSKEKNAVCDGHSYTYVVHPEISDEYSSYKGGTFTWKCGDSSGSSSCSNSPDNRNAVFYTECIGSSTSFDNQKVTYKVCDYAGNCASGSKSF